MIKHYLIASFRNLRKNLLYSLINIIGLTLGISSIIFVFAWIYDETSFDNFHPNVNQLYRVEALMNFESPTLWIKTPAPLSESIKKDFNEIVYSSKIKCLYKPIVKLHNQPIVEKGFYFVTPEFFKMFGLEVFASNPEEIISNPNTILISKSTAEKYFGSENPIGKTLTVNKNDNYTISGVFKDYPFNSHLELNFIASFSNLNLTQKQKEKWDGYSYSTYITLRDDIDIKKFQSKIKNYLANFNDNPIAEFQLQKVKDIHLYADSGKGNITYIYVFTIIGILILAIAFINFINISTAKALERAKEIAIRKTHGATRKILRKQIFTELSVLVFISVIFSIIITAVLIPVVNNISAKEFDFNSLFSLKLSLTVLILIIISIIASGYYPAIYLSSLDPNIIVSKKTTSNNGGLTRKILVLFQLMISVILILGAIVIQKQLNFIQNKNLGFDKEQLLYIDLSSKAKTKFKAVGESIMQIGGIDSIAFSHDLPINMREFRHVGKWDGHTASDEKIMINQMYIDDKFLPLYNVKIKAGRNFREDDNKYKLIINQKAVDKMGLQNPIGSRVYMDGNNSYEIVGVTDNFHFKPLTNEIAPIFLYYCPVNSVITVKMNVVDIHGTVKKIEREVTNILPENPFVFGFVDQEIENLYRTEMRIGKLVSIFMIIAIITSCLGIFGLSAFMAESRTKEIGIRKTLGSSTKRIIFLLSKEILLITVLANIFGGIVGYRILIGWLSNFQYKIQLSSSFFIIVLLTTILITTFTVSYHAIRSSRLNPAKVLKYE